MVVDLNRIVAALDELFALNASAPDTAMSRHLPRVFDEVGTDWRAFVEPLFAQRFNGLMRRGHPTVRTVYGACFPSAEVIDAWLAVARRGDLLVTHHPIDVRNGSPEDDTWAEGFVPIDATQLKAIAERELSMYACHAPMDTSLRVGTAAAIVEALNGTVVNQFWPYGDGHAGLVADIPTISSTALVDRAREIFAVDTVEVAGAIHDALTRVAVVGGIGDHVDQMALAERMGAQAYLTGELHVRIEGDYGRRKFADVNAFSATTGMTLIGVSHAASEHLVIETQLARWIAENHRITLRPIREPRWWR
ncbi:Nif3-like dinuclear metal center hexameric protein [Micromonospora sp. WMMD967]|uniref:Nif3-like dinuclear metal center hexameric protein n=1 Tax=Micromonospora sp. WMMD967 TaxID=3016101 RepID=UPI002417A674|nr:Nif3-like dinuclear metal center hexameric protein [Micromonospora sp. WMMD967]MDG4836307.1 Nif3-like dinuclear metal center hexameric protein [Micromonospora sp. WMMD967]